MHAKFLPNVRQRPRPLEAPATSQTGTMRLQSCAATSSHPNKFTAPEAAQNSVYLSIRWFYFQVLSRDASGGGTVSDGMSDGNPYKDESHMRAFSSSGLHRDAVGGLWDELGSLQLEFLKQCGLRPEHKFLDLGCGSLRAGVALAPHLAPGNYYGVDLSAWLIECGRKELDDLGLGSRIPEENFKVNDTFDLTGFPKFDFAIAQSVFTHMPISEFSRCLRRIRSHFTSGGRFYATFFVAPHGVEAKKQEPGGVVSYSHKDPFHFPVEDVIVAAMAEGWRARWIGDWDHPRNQQMCLLTYGL